MRDTALRQLVYVSASPALMGDAELRGILDVSQRNNAAIRVTGALLYAGGNFMQALEGPPAAVEAVFRRVEADARHRRVMVLYDAPAAERAFPDWSMGFVETGDGSEESRRAVETFYALTASQPGRARRLLASFRSLAPGA